MTRECFQLSIFAIHSQLKSMNRKLNIEADSKYFSVVVSGALNIQWDIFLLNTMKRVWCGARVSICFFFTYVWFTSYDRKPTRGESLILIVVGTESNAMQNNSECCCCCYASVERISVHFAAHVYFHINS